MMIFLNQFAIRICRVTIVNSTISEENLCQAFNYNRYSPMFSCENCSNIIYTVDMYCSEPYCM